MKNAAAILFLFAPFTNPHHPMIPHPDFKGKSKGGAYTDALMEIDYNTGLILDAVRYQQFKFHFIVDDKINPFQGAPEELGQIPFIYNLDTDPKEMFNLFGRSGGVAVFEPMVRDVLAPCLMSLRTYPNKDYSKMTRKDRATQGHTDQPVGMCLDGS